MNSIQRERTSISEGAAWVIVNTRTPDPAALAIVAVSRPVIEPDDEIAARPRPFKSRVDSEIAELRAALAAIWKWGPSKGMTSDEALASRGLTSGGALGTMVG